MLDYLDHDRVPEEYLRQPPRRRRPPRRAGAATTAPACTARREVAAQAVERARASGCSRPGVEVEPRRQWPTGLTDLSRAGSSPSWAPSRAGRWAGSPTSAGATGCASCSPTAPRRAGARRRVRGRGQGAGRLGLARAPGRRGQRALRDAGPQLVRSLAERLAQVGPAALPGRARLPGGTARTAVQQRPAGPGDQGHAGHARGRWAPPSPRAAGRCCWWTTGSTPAGP